MNLKTQQFILFLLLPVMAGAQGKFSSNNLEREILAYKPVQKAGVSEADFDKAKMILESTQSATKGEPSNFNVADYWNITVVLCLLNESPASVEVAFKKAATSDPQSLCQYIEAFGGKSIQAKIPEVFNLFLASCEGKAEAAVSLPGKESELSALMREINQRDQRYRSGHTEDLKKQARFDGKNQALIDSLYNVYNEYIGSDYVGQDLEHVMWAVIQHSNLDMMEKYLPEVHKATTSGALSNSVPLKMLIDRIYTLKTGHQIFGSQQGIPLAEKEERERVADQYIEN